MLHLWNLEGNLLSSLFLLVVCGRFFAMRTLVLTIVMLCGIMVATRASERWDPDPPWDHQEKTYRPHFWPGKVDDVEGEVELFWSPTGSARELSDLITNTPDHGWVDVGTPGFSSWIGCSYGGGCSVEEQKYNETFPIFPALLNAIANGISVRILTNDYERPPPSKGNIEPLTYLYLAGADVKYYATTTFWHAKYIAVGPNANANANANAKSPTDSSRSGSSAEKRATAISSVNFSQTSFRKNREAGVILRGHQLEPILELAADVFESDWENGKAFTVDQVYSESQLKMIRDKEFLPVVIPKDEYFPGAFYAPTTKADIRETDVSLVVSPDYAFETIKAALDATEHTFLLYIYQVTDVHLCAWLEEFASRSDHDLYLLVSYAIFDYTDYKTAQSCYYNLTRAGVHVRTTAPHLYSFSHQKLWITDNSTMWLSTGNWSPSDYPKITDATIFPPFNHSSSAHPWIQANRDFTVAIDADEIVRAALDVFDGDFHIGQDWH